MRTFISFILLTAFSNIYAANITAQIDVNPVLVNDIFHLTYTASGSVDDDPDFSAIKKYFELLGTQQSSNMSMINGSITRSKKWTLTLLAKEKGVFSIPAISFGSDQAAKINIVVKAVPISNTATPNQNFILEMESSQQSGFIQQQFIITVKLLVGQNISNYQFSDLTTSNSDTIILPLGKDQQYKTYRGKKQYIIVEKKYAIFPQKAETLKINPFVAAIAVSSQSSNSRFYDPFNTRTTTKRLHSKSINLKVKDIPSQHKGSNWLPSTSVKLKEEWPQNQKFIAGEPITRTLTLSAKGLTSAQLPKIKQQAIEGLKQYPDQPESNEELKTTGLIAIRKEKIALIPTQAGRYTLPAITIPWWNTKTNKLETAHLAQRTFTVLPAPNETAHNTTKLMENNESETQTTIVETQSPVKNTNTFWFWLSLLFLMLWLITLTLWWRSKSKTPLVKKEVNIENQSLSTCLKHLKSACESNNAQDTKKALLDWAKVVYPDTQLNNLSDIANQVDELLKQDITSLNAYLYSPQTTEWQCKNIYKKCKEHKQIQHERKTKTNSAKLEPFNLDDSKIN